MAELGANGSEASAHCVDTFPDVTFEALGPSRMSRVEKDWRKRRDKGYAGRQTWKGHAVNVPTTASTHLNILSGGAAEALVNALAAGFKAATGCDMAGDFGAVGVKKEQFLAGAPADLLILTGAIIADLERDGHVVAGSAQSLGVVRTGIAVRDGDPAPQVGDSAALREALLAADAIHTADTKRATAGIHFAKVLTALGIADEVAPRLRIHANGNTAMRALAVDTAARPIGCTQMTEILGTPGVTLVDALPKAHELATTYTIGICTESVQPELARAFAALLTGEETQDARARAGFGR